MAPVNFLGVSRVSQRLAQRHVIQFWIPTGTHPRAPPCEHILDMSSSSNKLEHSRHKDVSGRARRGLGRRRRRFVPTRHRVNRGEQTETEPRSRRNLFSRGDLERDTRLGEPDPEVEGCRGYRDANDLHRSAFT
jgi:hypothetical protein